MANLAEANGSANSWCSELYLASGLFSKQQPKTKGLFQGEAPSLLVFCALGNRRKLVDHEELKFQWLTKMFAACLTRPVLSPPY